MRLQGYVTVRELINRLIELNPDELLTIQGGAYNLSLNAGRQYLLGGKPRHVFNSRPIWEM
jgi:hypothetical protein